MNRGDRRERIFMDDADRRRFVETLGEVCAKTGWQVHAYVLMPNHFHVVVETPQPNLVAVSPGGSKPASLRCLLDRVFEVEGQESVGGWIAG
jgi:REP element-mobilizing transposase RayT